MKAGAFYFPTAYSMPVAALAVALEERGFESLWLPEHSHIPVRRESPWAGGDELPRHYQSTLDPLVALAAAAAVTQTLRLATGVALVVQRDPIQLAKELATLDVISNGRLEVGVGAGWNLEEMRNHGTDPARRFRLMRERVEAMKEIWTNDEAEYHGELVDFEPILSWPKPLQRPHPRVHVGGSAPAALKRVVRYGDGWIPIAGRDDTDFVGQSRTLRESATATGRDGAALQITICAAPRDQRALERFAEGGIDRVLFALPSEPTDAVSSRLDKLQQLAAPFLT
jgi:probable F420-dependent oxidoreductase